MDNAYLLFGPPGTGKTTWIGGQSKRAADKYMPQHVMLASYTRAAAHEMASRDTQIPGKNIGTLHSFCFRALDGPELTQGNEKDWNSRYPHWSMEVKGKKKSSSSADPDLTDDPFADNSPAPGDAFLQQLDLLRARRVKESMWPSHLLAFSAAWKKWKVDAGLMDFTDLLERCLEEVDVCPGDPAVFFFDEAQDSSALQMELVAKWGQHMQRLVLAGDDDQAIYYWAGADADSFLDFPVAPGNKRYLTQSYRLPRSVHKVADRFVQRLSRRESKNFLPRDDDGSVEQMAATWRQPEQAIRAAQRLTDDGKTVMFLASCSYMLDPLKWFLRKNGIPFHNPWRKKRGDWNPLSSGGLKRTMPVDRLAAFLKPDRAVWGQESGFWSRRNIHSWTSVLEIKKALLRGAREQIKAFRDDDSRSHYFELATWMQHEFLTGMENFNFVADSSKAVAYWLEHMKSDEKKKLEYQALVFATRGAPGIRETPKITIGTGHSLKGSQADWCFVFPDLSRKGWESYHQPDGRDSVIRLLYVMMTRAKEGLVLCRPASPMYVDVAA